MKLKFFRTALLGAAALTLVACTDTPASVSRAVGPGNDAVDGFIASALFLSICDDAGRDFALAETRLADHALFDRAPTGTYYHRNANLSFKIITDSGPAVCSMVFASNENPNTLAITMAAAAQQVANTTALVDINPGTLHRVAVVENGN